MLFSSSLLPKANRIAHQPPTQARRTRTRQKRDDLARRRQSVCMRMLGGGMN
jgi:hypothetical protein